MQGPITKDTILAQIPSHILESYPNFVAFLEAYYEWVSRDDGVYDRIHNHMDYLSFEKSIDSYVEAMKQEYLVDVPDNVLLDKELFIKWSKKFNIARGSHNSYKFLFKLLFDEQDTEIYLPKENILRTSDGEWISNEFRLLVTNTGTAQDFQLARIIQEREPFPGVFEYAYANVQTVSNRYSGRYNVLELVVSDVEGTFKSDYPIKTQTGVEEWLIDTVSEIDIAKSGSGYREGAQVKFENLGRYEVQRQAINEGEFDTRVTSYFKPSDLVVEVNGTQITDFEFDGRIVTSNQISIRDTVFVSFPSYSGYMVVDCTCTGINRVLDINILEAPIGISANESLYIDSQEGTGFEAQAVKGFLSPIVGYYEGNKGQLSSNMYLQDSFYYQEYSYAVRTEQSIENYGDTVKKVLHPAGFAMFGYLRIIDIIEILIGLESSEYEILPFEIESRAKYSLGANYSFFDRFKHGLSGRLYNLSHFQDKPYVDPVIEQRVYMNDDIIINLDTYVENNLYIPSYSYRYDIEMAVGEQKAIEPLLDAYTTYMFEGDTIIEDIDTYMNNEELDPQLLDQYDTEVGYMEQDYIEFDYYALTDGEWKVVYKLEDSSLEKTYISGAGGYIDVGYINSDYYQNKGNWNVELKGWMTKHNLQDYHLYIPQDYTEEVESGFNYFETGYTSERAA